MIGQTPTRPPDAIPSKVAPACLIICTVILCGGVAWWLRGILTPFVLAVFLLLMIEGAARFLDERFNWLHARAALVLALVLIVLFFAVTIWLMVDNASGFVSQSDFYAHRLNAVLKQLWSAAGLRQSPTVDQLIGEINPTRYMGLVAGGLQTVASNGVFILIYLGFLIASREGFRKKARKLFPPDAEGRESNRLFERVRHGVEQYIWIQTVTGLMIGVASGVLMAGLGLSHAVFWAFVIFLSSYIPIIGGFIGVLIPPLFGLVEFDGLVRPLALLGGLEIIQFVVGNIIQPRMQGDNLNLDPVVVLLSLAFWGAIWGITGAFLSTPLTVLVMAVMVEFDSTRWISVLLSSDGEPFTARASRSPKLLPSPPD